MNEFIRITFCIKQNFSTFNLSKIKLIMNNCYYYVVICLKQICYMFITNFPLTIDHSKFQYKVMDNSNNAELPQPMGINPPPILKSEKTDSDYIPQIHADERETYVDCKLNEEITQEETKIQNNPKETILNTAREQDQTQEMEKIPYPKEKKAIKLLTVPQENEGLQKNDKNDGPCPNPQEYDSPSIDIKGSQMEGDDAISLSPTSVILIFINIHSNLKIFFKKLPMMRKKSILKGSPNLLGENSQRFDAEGNVIKDDKKHRISFRPDLYQINEVESYKNVNDDCWKKCCKVCSIQ